MNIIEQTAAIFLGVFLQLGGATVIEHHSTAEYDCHDMALRLATENLDATIIVTTAVQFFDSLYANKPSKCRKLHRIARSVVIRDEPQTLPFKLGFSLQTLSIPGGVTLGTKKVFAHVPVRINRCGVLAGAGQFGTAEQGIFSYWIHAWRSKRPLNYIGFEGTGFQVRDAFHPGDLAALVIKQLSDTAGGATEQIWNTGGGLENSMSLLELSSWCRDRFGDRVVSTEKNARPFDIPWIVMDSTRAKSRWDWRPETRLESILEEIANHAEANPKWLEICGA